MSVRFFIKYIGGIAAKNNRAAHMPQLTADFKIPRGNFMSEYRIYDSIKKGKKHVSFHTPGHKGGGALAAFCPACRGDVTELSFTDDLGSPSGAIAAAQSDVAMIAGAKRAYFTTDGSTSGVFAMLWALKGRGGKIIVPRNSHKSVWNACRLLGFEPVIVQGEENEGVLTPPDPAQIVSLLAADEDICGMIAVSPDYYGNIAPLEKYAEILHAYRRVLAVDGAHGAHLAFGEDKKLYAGAHADMWVDGAHKSLPTLTQGAAVFLNNLSLEEGLTEGLSVFRTTSPSFPVMASVEFGYKYTAAHIAQIARVKGLALSFKAKFPDLTFYPSGDWSKLCLDCAPLTIDSRKLGERLEKSGIYAEFADGRYLVFYLSPSTAAAHFKKLASALVRALKVKKLRGTYFARKKMPVPARTYSFLYALGQPSEYIPVGESAGRMSACNAGLMPPCVPLVAAGEMISEAEARALKNAAHTFGLSDGRIKVVKKG
mgnify:FL=1